MKIGFKSIALATTLCFAPLKTTNVVRPVKYYVKHAPEYSLLTDLTMQSNQITYDFFSESLMRLREKEARKKLNIINMPRPAKNLDVSKTKFVGHPEFLNMFLGGVMKGKGEQFINAQEKYGINASFLVGVANLESGYGLSDFARNRNNIAGMRTNKGYMYFTSVDECIDRMAANLKKKYVDDGLTTIEQIHTRYAEDPEWGDRVVNRMDPIYRASHCKFYDF